MTAGARIRALAGPFSPEGGEAIARDYGRAPLDERLTAWGWWLKERVLPDYVSDSEPIVIGGCGRSGTTLLQVIFDAHPVLCCVNESSILQPARLHTAKLAKRMGLPREQLRELAKSSSRHAEFVDRAFGELCRTTGARTWAEKSPRNVRRLDYVFRHFPRARFVHVIRDGRDAVCSLRTHNRVRREDGREVQTGPLRPVEGCARRWVEDVGAGLAWRDHPNYREIRYEELVTDLEGALRRLLESLGEEFSPEMLDYHRKRTPETRDRNFRKPIFGTSLGRWRRDLSEQEAAQVDRICGPLLAELGYTGGAGADARLEAHSGATG